MLEKEFYLHHKPELQAPTSRVDAINFKGGQKKEIGFGLMLNNPFG